MTIHQYTISGMTCGGCLNRVQETLAAFAQHAEVTLEPPEATLTDATVDINALNAALAQVGNYQLTAIQNKAAVKQTIAEQETTETKSWFATYKPLLLVFAYILLSTLTLEVMHGSFELTRWMPHFMAGFFLVFSFFKLLDLTGFASSYAMYDLLAKRMPAYGYIYPFIELGLGLWYLLGWQPIFVNWVTLIVMGFSTIGVILAVMKQQKIRCACLGTGFNLPMSTVTIIEDLTMVGMALWMLT
jgi:copper chaperone CopZ